MTTEQERYDALNLMSANDEGSEKFDEGLQVLVEYIFQEAARQGEPELEFEEIHKRVNESFAGHLLTELTKKGLLEVDLNGDEPTYTATELGQKVRDYYNKDKGV